MDEHPTFSQWLRRQLKRLDISQEDLGKRAGYGRSYVNQLANDRVKLPTPSTRERLHAILGTTDQDLIDAGVFHIDPRTEEEVPGPYRGVRASLGAGTASARGHAAGDLSASDRAHIGSTERATVHISGVSDGVGGAAGDIGLIPPSLQASFLQAGRMTPERQKQIEDYINLLAKADAFEFGLQAETFRDDKE